MTNKTYTASQLCKGDRFASISGIVESVTSLGSGRYVIRTDNAKIECSRSRKFVLFNR